MKNSEAKTQRGQTKGTKACRPQSNIPNCHHSLRRRDENTRSPQFPHTPAFLQVYWHSVGLHLRNAQCHVMCFSFSFLHSQVQMPPPAGSLPRPSLPTHLASPLSSGVHATLRLDYVLFWLLGHLSCPLWAGDSVATSQGFTGHLSTLLCARSQTRNQVCGEEQDRVPALRCVPVFPAAHSGAHGEPNGNGPAQCWSLATGLSISQGPRACQGGGKGGFFTPRFVS